VSEVRPAGHQTIKLSAGHHRVPGDEACVMELASMLAHEPFSDRPDSVCPVIAGFLRSYNDHVDAVRRQDLYPYAALVVGTRADSVVERRRAEMCIRWARELCDPPPLRVRLLHRLLRCQGPDIDGVYAARAAVATRDRTTAHHRALALLDEMIGVSRREPRWAARLLAGSRDLSVTCVAGTRAPPRPPGRG
jgi:hypothetical protein